MPSLVFFGLAYMVPLTVWTTYGVVTTSTEGHLPAAYIVTTLAMLLTAYSYGRMVVAHPRAGSAYAYAKSAFGKAVGFIVGWVLLLDYIFLPMICYLVIGLYMHDYFPSIPMWMWIVGSVLLTTLLNIIGIRVIAGVNFIFIAAQFVFIAVFVVLSVRKLGESGVHSFTTPFLSSGMNVAAVFGGAAILALSFLGFDAVSTLSEETKNPTVRIPRAILLCTVLGGALYILESYIGHLIFPDYTLFSSVDVATVDVMKHVGGDLLNSFFTAAYVAGCFASALASQASVSRILFAMGRDGVLPKPIFGHLHPRFRTPVVPNIIVGALGLSALFISLEKASSMISFGALAAFTFVNLAVIKHYVIDKGKRSPGDLLRYALVPGLGVAFNAYLWTSLSGPTFAIGLTWLAVGVAYLLTLTRGFSRPVPDLSMDKADHEGNGDIEVAAQAAR
ncbi:APC family permease [Rhodococcus opacus]|nr:APC family permease [Rhodococcus opacus]